MINQTDAKKFVQGVFTEVWTHRNRDAVTKYYHKDFIGLLHGTEEFRFDDVLKRVDYSFNHYQDIRVIYDDILVVENNRIVARITMNFFDKEEQKSTTLHLMALIEIQDGKMIRQWTLSNHYYRYKAWE